MAFTYSETMTAARDRVRFYINDTILNNGPKPNKQNFSDAEIDAMLEFEGHWGRAIAACFEALSGAWAKETDVSFSDQSYGRSTPSQQFAAQAGVWRVRYGFSGTGGDPDSGKISTELRGGTISLGYAEKWP
jgi:hypothetical protein